MIEYAERLRIGAIAAERPLGIVGVRSAGMFIVIRGLLRRAAEQERQGVN